MVEENFLYYSRNNEQIEGVNGEVMRLSVLSGRPSFCSSIFRTCRDLYSVDELFRTLAF